MRRLAVFILGLAALAAWDAQHDPARRAAHAQAWDLVADADSTQVIPEDVLLRRIEMLLRNGRRDEAVSLLEDRQEKIGLSDNLTRRLARLYDQTGRYPELEKLLGEKFAAEEPPHELADLRMLAEALLAQGKDDEGKALAERILERNPEDPGLIRLVATLFSHHDHTDEAIRVLVEGRERMGDPHEFAQHLGTLYSESGRAVDAVGEYLSVVVTSPMNVGLMRGQILEVAENEAVLPELLVLAEARFAENPQVPQLGLVVAELRQRAGNREGAWEVLEPMLDEEALLQNLMQMSMAGLADSRLPGADPDRVLSSLRLSSRVLRGLLRGPTLPRTMQPRIFDTLNRTLLAILENERFEALPKEDQLALLGETRETIVEMGSKFPNDRLTASALLRLADIYVGSLQRADDAVELYRRLEMDPNAPREQLQMARVGLGRAYVAAGDTAAARELFTRMGKDRSFEGGRGRAHYHLGMLDFMGGHFQTAQERLSSVAIDTPNAEYTNDSLDLALLLAEERLSGAPDEQGLAGYGRALYHRATFQADSLVTQLESLRDARGPSLAQRVRLDLARHWLAEGETPRAMTELDALVRNSAYSRYAATALELKGDTLAAAGDVEGARAAYRAIVLEHEGYVFADSVRDKLRGLPAGDADQGDLP